jgi:hypothetical protein
MLDLWQLDKNIFYIPKQISFAGWGSATLDEGGQHMLFVINSKTGLSYYIILLRNRKHVYYQNRNTATDVRHYRSNNCDNAVLWNSIASNQVE